MPDLNLELIKNFNKDTMVENLGIEFTHYEKGMLKASMPVSKKTIQPMKLLHGGANVALAESLASIGSYGLIEEHQHALGLEINANHLRSVKEGSVHGICKIIHQGRTIHIWETRILDDQERLCCISRCTIMIK